ncbi:MAG: transcriptional regulator [Thermoplasmata archaeon]|nr:transcriptional regulator [Thermoplasmata archaeon]
MAKKEKEDGNKNIREELKDISEKMASLESTMGDISKPYGEFAEHMASLRKITEGYFRIIDLYRTHGRISPDLLLPEVKDGITKEIVNILFEKPELNISQIADILKERRGSASRKTVREKLNFLVEVGAVEILDDKKTKRYVITQELADRWLKILGLS